MNRTIYIALIAAYALMIGVYFLKYEISYRSVSVRPEIIEQRSLTYEEHKSLKHAERIRYSINMWMLIFSVLILMASSAAWYFNLISPLIFPKIVFLISGIWTIILLIVNGIHFIAHPPIR